MSILQRFSSSITRLPHGRPSGSVAVPAAADRVTISRLAYPDGVFASLYTTPVEVADAAYDAFTRHALTPTLAEREVLRVLREHAPRCLPAETTPACIWEMSQESTDAGKLRAFVHHLVRMQLVHETNQRELARLRATHEAGRVRILSGCCEVCDALARRSYRLSSAPSLPVHGCQRHGGCVCGWVGA
jgi:hypothetical protein